jgi:hypothetical protein
MLVMSNRNPNTNATGYTRESSDYRIIGMLPFACMCARACAKLELHFVVAAIRARRRRATAARVWSLT